MTCIKSSQVAADVAAARLDVTKVDTLINEGADVNAKTHTGATAQHFAMARRGTRDKNIHRIAKDILKLLIDAGAEEEPSDKWGILPVMLFHHSMDMAGIAPEDRDEL